MRVRTVGTLPALLHSPLTWLVALAVILLLYVARPVIEGDLPAAPIVALAALSIAVAVIGGMSERGRGVNSDNAARQHASALSSPRTAAMLEFFAFEEGTESPSAARGWLG